MVREFFGAGMLFSLVGAGVLGGAMAWSNQTEVYGTTAIGSIDFDFGVDGSLLMPTGLPVGPPGRTATILNGRIQNLGDFSIVLEQTSTVEVTGVTNVDTPEGSPACLPTYFTPRFVLDNYGSPNILPGATGGNFHIDMTLDPTAPFTCSDQDVSYRLSVVVRTAGSPPAAGGANIGSRSRGTDSGTFQPPPPVPGSSPSPTETATATMTATSSPSATATTTASPSASATASATSTASSTATATSTASSTETATATASQTATASVTASATASSTAPVGGTP